jgi:hypothetical protein
VCNPWPDKGLKRRITRRRRRRKNEEGRKRAHTEFNLELFHLRWVDYPVLGEVTWQR